MKVESILNILHFSGIPNGRSLKKILTQQAETRRKSISEELNNEVRSITSRFSNRREECDLIYQTLLDKTEADLDLVTAELDKEWMPEEFDEIAARMQKLVEEKIRIRNDWRADRRTLASEEEKSLFEAQMNFRVQMDTLEAQLNEQLGELRKESIRKGVEIRSEVLKAVSNNNNNKN